MKRKGLKVHFRVATLGSVSGDALPYCGIWRWFGENERLTKNIKDVTCLACRRYLRAPQRDTQEETTPRCESCENCDAPDAEYVIDPYSQDVWNEEVWCWLCATCEQERVYDI